MKTNSIKTTTSKTSAPGVQNRNEPARTNTDATAPAPATAGVVHFHGPEYIAHSRQPASDDNGEPATAPVWYVFVGDADANPLGRIYRVRTFAKAAELALAMSRDRSLALTQDAQPA